MKEPIVAINFCGGCNPVIDRRDIALGIRSCLSAQGYVVAFNDWEADYVVRLSGCSANCAARFHPSERPGATVAGQTFNAAGAPENELTDLALAAIKAHFSAPPECREGASKPDLIEQPGQNPVRAKCEETDDPMESQVPRQDR